MTKASTENAQFIAANLAEAVELMNDARKALARAESAINAKETEPEFKTSTIVALHGSLTLSNRALIAEANAWEGFALARAED